MPETSSQSLRQQAEHLRQLAREIVDDRGQQELHKLADEYEARAAEVEHEQS